MRYSKIFALAFVLIFSFLMLCACAQTPNEQEPDSPAVSPADTAQVVSPGDTQDANDIEQLKKELEQGKFSYVIGSANNTVTITDYYGEAEHIVIPEGVTHIGYRAFGWRQFIKEVTLPQSIVYIEEGAFAECYSLEKINLPDSIAYIGNAAFINCAKLRDIVLPKSITEINLGTFTYCDSLTDIYIPAGVTRIGSMAFFDCESLTRVVIPSSVVQIDMPMAFGDYFCQRLPGSDEVIEYTEVSHITIVCARGSFAYEYASSLGFNVEIDDSL